MSMSAVAASNTSSRRATAPQARGIVKSDHGVRNVAKSQADEATTKRPKRTLKLTASQRERKRAIDREAQRSIRLKTKNYIAHLENLVQIMESGGSVTNCVQGLQPIQHHRVDQNKESAASLLTQLKERDEEIQRLKAMLSNAETVIRTTTGPLDDHSMKQLGLNSYYYDQQVLPLHTFNGATQEYFDSCGSAYSPGSETSSHMFEPGYQSFDQSSLGGSPISAYSVVPSNTSVAQIQESYNNLGRAAASQIPKIETPTSEPAETPRISPELEPFYIHGQEISRVIAGGPRSFTNQPLDEDIIVRAVLYGWREVQEEYLLDKGWQAIRNLDQATFRGSGIVERMACLYMMRLKLLHQSNTNPHNLQPLPAFLERGSDENPEVLKRLPLIEHLVWPGFRTYLCEDPKRLTSKLGESYKMSMKFVWPHEISDLFVRDPSTHLYSLSPAFKQQQRDLRSWTMRKDFFINATELLGLIPVYESPMTKVVVPSQPIQTPVAVVRQPSPQQVPCPPQMSSTQAPRTSMMASAPLQTTQTLQYPSTAPAYTPTLSKDTPSTLAQYAPGVEVWLGDQELVPHYWNMQSPMDYNVMPQQWQQAERTYIS
jgi:hypothetical protein